MGGWGHSLVQGKAPPPSSTAGPAYSPPISRVLALSVVSQLQLPPRQPQVEVRVVIGSHGPPSDLLKLTPTSAGFFRALLDVHLKG